MYGKRNDQAEQTRNKKTLETLKLAISTNQGGDNVVVVVVVVYLNSKH